MDLKLYLTLIGKFTGLFMTTEVQLSSAHLLIALESQGKLVCTWTWIVFCCHSVAVLSSSQIIKCIEMIIELRSCPLSLHLNHC